jgi:hypothetical protein
MMRLSPPILIVAIIPLIASGQQAIEAQKAKKNECVANLSGFPKSDTLIPKPPYPEDGKGVTLEYFESGCFGNCESFTLTISDGIARFEGRSFTLANGKKTAKLKPGEFDEFIHVWFDANFYAMRDDYCSIHCPDGTSISVTDIPESSIKLKTSNFTKQVYQCFATIDGEPETPRPPDQYFELTRKLRAFAKAKHWL